MALMLHFLKYSELVESAELSPLMFIIKDFCASLHSLQKSFCVYVNSVEAQEKYPHSLLITQVAQVVAYVTELKILFHYSLLFSLNSYLKLF